MERRTVPGNTLKTLRGALFRELQDLRNDKVDAQHANAVSKVSGQIIASYKVELDAVAIANNLKDKNLSYAANIAPILTSDTTQK